MAAAEPRAAKSTWWPGRRQQNQPVEVFFNEAYLGPIRPKTVHDGPIGLRATSLVRPGRNVVCLKVKGGLIRGPVFLTTEEPRRYPYPGQAPERPLGRPPRLDRPEADPGLET